MTLQFADVLDDRLAPAVDMCPRAVADPVPVAGYIDHVSTTPASQKPAFGKLRTPGLLLGTPHTLRAGRGNAIVRLLVSDDDQTIVAVLLVQLSHRLTESRARVRLRAVDGVAQGE